MRIAFDTFKAEIPKRADHALPNNYAKKAQNCKVVKGDLRAFNKPSREYALSLISVKSLFRYEENGNSHWIESADERNYVKSPVSGDQYERVYYSDGSQPYFFANDNISGGGFSASADKIKLGIPAPTTAPTVATTGGGATYRGYVYSFVNSYGEEGPPSPVGSDDDFDTGYVTLDSLDSAPTGRSIDKIYVYRTNASGTGTAEFQFVCEATWFDDSTAYAVGDYVIYSDDLYKCTSVHAAGAWNAGHFTQGENEADADLLSVYPKTNYDPPPAAIKGFTQLANGSIAGFNGNQLYFSEPYYAHAYPTDYIIAFDADIVGIAAEGNTVTVITENNPYTVYGTHPSTMQKRRNSNAWPGLNIRGITAGNNGVFFVTREGIIFSGDGGMTNITLGLMETSDLNDYSPNTLAIYWFENKLFAFDSVGESGFFIDFSMETVQFVSLIIYAHAGHVSDDGYFYMVCDDTSIIDENDPPENMPLAVKKWEGDSDNYLMFTWQSQEILMDVKTNFTVAKVITDQAFYNSVNATLDLVTLNAATFAAGLTGALGVDGPVAGGHEIAGDEMLALGDIDISTDIGFTLYADDSSKVYKVLSDTNNVFRLPGGYLSDRIYIKITGYIPVKKVVLATSPDELANY